VIVPSIDLQDGKAVQLVGGEKLALEAGDPAPIAERFALVGEIAVVDLDAALGRGSNAAVIEPLLRIAPCRVGGGIRDAGTARELVETGIDRVVFGTAAIEAREEVADAIQKLGPERVVAGIDARDGIAASRGWTEQSGMRAIDLILNLADVGVRRFMYTDITRDGTLQHPSFDSISEIINAVGYPVIVAGGIATVDDLVRLAELGAEGAVTGMAIYTGAIDLQQAIRAVEGIQ
jgi:phosphoribosylformimino-5-aminoimidazole carboxamide ribotide isomerase